MSEVTKPPSTLDALSSTFTPSAATLQSSSEPKSLWADEVASPTEEKPSSTIEAAQTDGAAEPQGGSGLHDAQYEVEVKLSDIQGDESSPLFSISSFEQLGM
jgi:ATP-dependent RNA helicase DDX19/DBP5